MKSGSQRPGDIYRIHHGDNPGDAITTSGPRGAWRKVERLRHVGDQVESWHMPDRSTAIIRKRPAGASNAGRPPPARRLPGQAGLDPGPLPAQRRCQVPQAEDGGCNGQTGRIRYGGFRGAAAHRQEQVGREKNRRQEGFRGRLAQVVGIDGDGIRSKDHYQQPTAIASPTPSKTPAAPGEC